MPDPINLSHTAPFLVLALLFGYLVGSIPFGVILTRLSGTGDLRKIGSGNIGATNVLRTGNKGLAALTLLGDLFKGTIAVWAAGKYGPDTAIVAGFAAFIGHCFPVWLRFKGGKGVATYIGILLAFSWKGVVLFALVWLGTAFVTRYSSLAGLLASLTTPIAIFALAGSLVSGISHLQLAQLFAAMTVILWIRHRENIKRLISGTESRIGKKS